MIRPEVLYRGTPSTRVEEFVPKESVGNRLVVSASPDKTFATMFVVPIEGLNVKTGIINNTHYYMCAEKEKFTRLDVGGAIYKLPTDGFELAPETGEVVWINPDPVRPISKESVSSALKAMIVAGIQVYFVTAEMLDRFANQRENRAKILQSLKPETIGQDS